jgi:hypothetical protein
VQRHGVAGIVRKHLAIESRSLLQAAGIVMRDGFVEALSQGGTIHELRVYRRMPTYAEFDRSVAGRESGRQEGETE